MTMDRMLRAAVMRVLGTSTVVATGFLLAFNIAALIMSAPHIIDGIPREYSSHTYGTVDLPYTPLTHLGMDVDLPIGVHSMAPFDVSVTYPSGRIPYGIQYLMFTNAEGLSSTVRISLHHRPDTGRWSGGARVPGLVTEGEWNVSLVGRDAPGGIEMYNVTLPVILDVTPPGPGTSAVMPLIGEDHEADGLIELSFSGEGFPEGIGYRFDNGTPRSVDMGYPPSINCSGLGPGWHLLTIFGPGWERDHPIYRSLEQGNVKDAPDITVEKVFNGSDGAYSQEEMAPIKVIGGNISLQGMSFYRIELGYPPDGRVALPGALSGMEHLLPRHAQGVKIGDRLYPASPSEDDRTWTAVVWVGGNRSSFSAATGPLSGGSQTRPRFFSIDVMADRALRVELSPDPFLPVKDAGASGCWLSVSDINYQLGRKSFRGPPDADIEGVGLEPIKDNPNDYWTRYSYEIAGADLSTGPRLELNASASYRYDNGLYILLPIPPFLFTLFTIPGGFPVVVYFMLLSAAILGSCAYLLRKPLKALILRGSNEPGSVDLSGEEGDLKLTGMVYSSIIFLSIAVVLLFRIVEQPTPVPGILSTMTPVHFRMLMLAEASVWEEIVSRVLYIGVPLAIYNAFTGRRGILGGLLGGTRRVGKAELVLILFSASLFGIAHAGWGPWKVLPTFLSGLLFGYLFVKVGLHASIIVHFLIDYASFFWEIIPGAEYAEWIYVVLILIFIVAGMFNMGLITGRAAARTGLGSGSSRAIIASAHSILSMLMAVVLIAGSGSHFFMVAFICTPLPYIFWWLMDRYGLGQHASWAVLIYSPLTLLFAPFGIAFWHMVREDDHGQGVPKSPLR